MLVPGFDVTVRIPHQFANVFEAAGFVERAVSNEMKSKGWSVPPAVVMRAENDKFVLFQEGYGFEEDETKFTLPHGLVRLPSRTIRVPL